MKKILLLGAVLCAVLGLTSCQGALGTDLGTRVAELETAIEQERAASNEAKLQYEARIKELELQLAQLSGVDVPKDEEGERLVFTYQVIDGKAVVTKYNGTAAIVTVPAEIEGHSVYAIGERAFEGCNVTAVILPEGVVDIGWFAFYNCASLLNVTLPATVRSIGYAVFDGCSDVTLTCPLGSYAEQYAKAYGMPHDSTP